MTEDWEDLMGVEENHGRKRGESGWKSLENTYQDDIPYQIEDPEYRTGQRRVKEPWEILHGTLSAYTHDGCRCDLCRAEMRAWKRSRRNV